MNQIIAKLKILKERALQNVRLLLGRSILQCTGLNMNLQNLYVEILKFDQILVEDGTFGRKFGYEGRTFRY